MRASLPAKVLGATLVIVLAALASGSALAFFTTTGSGSASAGVSQLSTPSISSATPGIGGTVTLNWNAVTAPGPGAVAYTLTRDGEDPGGNCPKSPTQIITCVDTGVGIGTHSYVLTARWRSWSNSSTTATAKVTIGPVTHLDLKAASATPAAGAADNLTITAQDANDATVTTYTGSKSLVFSGASASGSGQKPTVSNSSGTAINFGSTTAITFSSGVASVSTTKNGVMRLYKSGPTSIDVSDGTVSSSPSLAVTVSSLTATKITLGVTSTKPVAGEANNTTVTATDTYGNQAAAYTGPKSLTFSTAAASPGGNVPTVSDSSGADVPFGTATTIAFNAGLASVEGAANGVMKLYKSGTGTVSLKVSDGSLTSATVSATVSPATASRFTLAGSATVAAGASNNLTTTAFDPYGNTATGYTGAKTLTYSGASASPSGSLPTVINSANTAINFGSPTAINFSSGVASVSSSKNGVMKIGRGGPASIVVSDGTISNTTSPLAVTVNPTTPTKLAYSNVTISAGVLGSTCLFTCSVTGLGNSGTVIARVNVTDSFGNTVSDIGKNHAAKVTSSGGTISDGTLTFPSAGAAESPTQFTYTAKSSGNYSDTITAATSEGSSYTSAMFTASR